MIMYFRIESHIKYKIFSISYYIRHEMFCIEKFSLIDNLLYRICLVQIHQTILLTLSRSMSLSYILLVFFSPNSAVTFAFYFSLYGSMYCIFSWNKNGFYFVIFLINPMRIFLLFHEI